MSWSLDASRLNGLHHVYPQYPTEQDVPQLVHSNASTTGSTVSSANSSPNYSQSSPSIRIRLHSNMLKDLAAPAGFFYTNDEIHLLSEPSGLYDGVALKKNGVQNLHEIDIKQTALSSDVQGSRVRSESIELPQLMVSPYPPSECAIQLPSINALFETTVGKNAENEIKYEYAGYRNSQRPQELRSNDGEQQKFQGLSSIKAAQALHQGLETKEPSENVAADTIHIGGGFHSPRDSHSLLTSNFPPQTPGHTYPRQETKFKGSPIRTQMSHTGQGHRRGPWTQEEDNALLLLVRTQGPNNWVRISQHMHYRSPKQCRERYHQTLKPPLNHGPITPEEGVLIEGMVKEMGKKWAEIARRLGQRSDNAVKNWWNGSLNRRRRIHNQHKFKVPFPVTESAVSTIIGPTLSLRNHELSRQLPSLTLPPLANNPTSSDDSSPVPIDIHKYQERFRKAADSIEPSSSQDSSARDAEETCDHCCSAFAHQTQEVLTRLMADVYALFNHQLLNETSAQVDCDGSGRCRCSSTNNTFNVSLGSSQGSSEKSRGKRKRVDRDSSPPEDNGGDDNKRPQLRRLQSDDVPLPRKLACPYFKRDPKTYNTFGSCTGPGFRTTSRVKYVLPMVPLTPWQDTALLTPTEI